MSSFWGQSFIFDSTSSELYDLRIFNFSESSPTNAPAGGSSSLSEKWLYHREKPYFYGRYFQEALEFDFVVGSANYIDGQSRHAIETWLLGRSTYIPLRIVQDDLSDVVYNVILTRSTHMYVGNLNYALSLHARCDAPWGKQYPPMITKTYAGGLMSETFDYINLSAFNGYNRPTITFTMDATATYFSIVNADDSNREFRFDGLSAGEVMTVDNDRGIITSSLGNLRMDKFNKNFFRMVQGSNTLTLSGYITNFTLDTIFYKGVGG